MRQLLEKIPVLEACVLVILHMPKHINQSIKKSLEKVTPMEVKLAEHGVLLENGVIFVAPSEVHTEIEDNQRIKLVVGEKVNFVCPSIDVAMNSLQHSDGVNIVGVILTGMGSDGVVGLSHIKRLGGTTFAQDEESSVIFGMPKVAIETGDVDFVLPPEMIGDKITELVRSVLC